jgi:hypothetical protein
LENAARNEIKILELERLEADPATGGCVFMVRLGDGATVKITSHHFQTKQVANITLAPEALDEMSLWDKLSAGAQPAPRPSSLPLLLAEATKFRLFAPLQVRQGARGVWRDATLLARDPVGQTLSWASPTPAAC